MLHYPSDVDNADIEALARSVGHLGGGKKPHLHYAPPANPCAGCGMPTGGVFCTDCATK